MTEKVYDMPISAVVSEAERSPSAAWFTRQGERFMGAVSILTRIGVLPEEIRSYKQAVDEQNDEERVLCDMALDVVKSVRVCRRFDKYGKDSDLYQLEIRKAASILLGRRATAAFARAHADL